MKFKLCEHVIIIPLELHGRIKQICISDIGTQFEVRYFWNSEAKSAWFYDDELMLKQDTKPTSRPSSGVDGNGITHYD